MDRVAPQYTNANCLAEDFSGWLPIRLFPRDGTVWIDWVYRGDHAFREPFFREDAQILLRDPFNVAFRRYTPIEDAVDWFNRVGTPRAPLKALIGHASRCGSTLVTQMLAHLQTHVVMSEPPMLDVLLSIRRQLPQVTRAQQVLWLRTLMLALGQAPGRERHLIVKLDAWHILDPHFALLAEAFPEVPKLFLYRHPVEIAASMFAEPSSYMIAGMVTAYAGLEVANAPEVSAEDFIADMLGGFLDAAAARCEMGSLIPVHYPSLPEAVWTGHAATFGLAGDPDEVSRLRAISLRNAKSPKKNFTLDSERKRAEVSELLRTKVMARCSASYERLLRLNESVSSQA
jgi:hypothetical protein